MYEGRRIEAIETIAENKDRHVFLRTTFHVSESIQNFDGVLESIQSSPKILYLLEFIQIYRAFYVLNMTFAECWAPLVSFEAYDLICLF